VKGLSAPAKINLALIVGALRPDGKHEVATVYERIDLADRVTLEAANALEVRGFEQDTLVASALWELASRVGVEPGWRVTIEKHIPVAAGLGGGSSDAASALRLANAQLERPLPPETLRDLAASIGADVPFFLAEGAQLGEGDGSRLTPLHLPREYVVVVVLPRGSAKASTAAVYAEFDARRGEIGFEERRQELLDRLGRISLATDLGDLPPNDLTSSPLTTELCLAGAFRADVTGSGPALYGLFETEPEARRAASILERWGRCWVAFPTWYG
jgi:4-diphosphocytidyl-2-C-methyl-D-erythritol kinase